MVGVGSIQYSICVAPRALSPYRVRITISVFDAPNPRIDRDRGIASVIGIRQLSNQNVGFTPVAAQIS